MIYYVAGIPYSDELYHSGRKGMKWHEHRFHSDDALNSKPPRKPPKKSKHSSGKTTVDETLNVEVTSSSSENTTQIVSSGKEAVDSILSGKKHRKRRHSLRKPPRKPPRRPPRKPPKR